MAGIVVWGICLALLAPAADATAAADTTAAAPAPSPCGGSGDIGAAAFAHVGVLGRVAGDGFRNDLLGVADLSLVAWSSRCHHLGLNCRFAGDGRGLRMGLGMNWFTPLEPCGRRFWQVKGGLYLPQPRGEDTGDVGGCYFEAELGLVDHLVLSGDVEVLYQRDAYLVRCGDAYRPDRDPSRTVAGYLGAKAGSIGALAPALLLLGIGTGILAALQTG